MKRRSVTLTLVCLGLAALLPSTCRFASPEAQLLQADAPRLTSPGVTEAQVTQLIAANNAFAYDLYRTLATGAASNLVYSPYSITLAFSMLYAGAQGQAEAQMAEVMFAIVARETGLILFSGPVLNPGTES